MRTFFPKESIRLDAAHVLGTGASYLVSRGTEMWEDGPADVVKIQVAQDAKVLGRRAPSFVVHQTNGFAHCDDFENIAAAVEKLVRPLRRWVVTWDRPRNHAGDVSEFVDTALKELFTLCDDEVERPLHQVRLVEVEAGTTARQLVQQIRQKMAALGAPAGTRIWVLRLSEDGMATI